MKDVNKLIENKIDVEKSLELFGDMETYNETLEEFLNNINTKMNDIKKYKESSDMANYAILVHSLKSDSKYLGFTDLAEISYNHEMESKNNNIGYVYDHYDELVKEANRIIEITSLYMGREIKTINNNSSQIINKGKQILVVDDSNVIRIFMQKIFNNSYDIIMATDGLEAISILENDKEGKIAGILLDLNMPNVDGFSVLDYFNNHNLFSKYPVSIITGEDNDDIINKARKYPIIDVLCKPFNERDIKMVVEKTVNYK